MLAAAFRAAVRANVSAQTTTATTKTASRAYTVGADLAREDVSLRDNDGKQHSTKTLFAGKKVVVVGVPGAFTPVCHSKHVPSFIKGADDILKKAQSLVCVSINDHFVMKAWAKELGIADGRIQLLADPDGAFTKAIGMNVDLSAAGLGNRSKRYSLIVDNGKIVSENVEKSPADFTVTGADTIIKQLS